MEDESTTPQPADLPAKRVQAGASDATLWLFLGGICFMLLLCVLFVVAASR